MHPIDWTMAPRQQGSYGSDDEADEQEMSPAKKMTHQSNGGTGVAHGLLFPQLVDESSPLGLNLSKTSSFLDLIQHELDQVAKVKGKEDTSALNTNSIATQGIKPSEKLKASNFQASLLRIGAWEWKSRYDGDLIAKLYFSKSKVAWEILHEGLKRKIEMKSSDICALKVTCPKGSPGTLDITVSVEPQFFRETCIRPHRNTKWVATTDFTGGQARTLRHFLQCDPGIMDKHIKNLLSRDHRLYLLSQENIINPESPCLEPCSSVPETPKSSSYHELYHSDDGYQFRNEQSGQSFSLHSMPSGTSTGGLDNYGLSHSVLFTSSVAAGTSMIMEEPSLGRDQLNSDMFNWERFFQVPSNVQLVMNSGNHINNQITSGNSHSGVDYSSSRMVLPEEIQRVPEDSTTNRQVDSGNRPSYSEHGVLFPSSVPAGTAVTIEEPSRGRTQLKKDMFNWKSFLQTPSKMQPFKSNAGIMNNDIGNRINNEINPGTFNSAVDYSSSSMALLHERRFPDDSTTNRQVNLSNQRSYDDGPSSRRTTEEDLPQYDFNGSQTLQQIDPGNRPSNISPSSERMVLEQICQNLLSDDEVADVAEEERLMSMENSLSCLLGRDSAPSSQSSQASNTQVAAPPDVE